MLTSDSLVISITVKDEIPLLVRASTERNLHVQTRHASEAAYHSYKRLYAWDLRAMLHAPSRRHY